VEKLNSEEEDKVEQMLIDLKCLLTGVKGNGYLGIGQISDDGQIGYDMHQVVRHCLAHSTKPDPTNWLEWTTDFDKPSQYGSEPLCQIKRCEEIASENLKYLK
jgi:hypothetical protein